MTRTKLYFWGLYLANKSDAGLNAAGHEQVRTAHESLSNYLRDVPFNTFHVLFNSFSKPVLSFDHPACGHRATSNTFNLSKNQLLYVTGCHSTSTINILHHSVVGSRSRTAYHSAKPAIICNTNTRAGAHHLHPHSSFLLSSVSTTNNAFYRTCLPIILIADTQPTSHIA